MSKLSVFENITLDGYFSGPNGDLSWAKQNVDDEWNKFVEENASSGGMLLMGRITYEMMIHYWPTPQASKNDPVVAERMNNMPKIVFSRTLEKPTWNNTKVVKGDIAAEVKRLKEEGGKDMTILGSGSIVSQLTQAGLIDEYKLSVNPVIIGKGRTVFEGVKDKMNLKLTKSRNFKNGNVVLQYEWATKSNL
jgi:dihydrofolate reductase